MLTAWGQDELVLDPSRITLHIGLTGIDGATFKREQLMDKFGIQINKTSRNTVLFITNIGTTQSSVAYLIQVLVKIVRELDHTVAEMGPAERQHSPSRPMRRRSPSPAAAALQWFPPPFHGHRRRPNA